MNDLISRQDAIEALYKKAFRLTVAEEYCYEGHVAWSADVVYRDVMEGALLELPSAQSDLSEYSDKLWRNAYERGKRDAQPKQRWIPCSERLPEDNQFVLMTIRRMSERYNHEPFISVGYISWNQSVWWCAHDGDCKSHDVRVDAWRPLPESYREEE